MFKSIVLIGLVFAASASAGLVETHHVVQPAVAQVQVGSIVQSSPSAVSHQSISQVHSKDVIQPVVAPLVKTTHLVSPVVHAAPLVHHHVQAAPLIKTVHHSVPVYHQTYAAAPATHSLPLVHSPAFVKNVVAAPIAYTLHH